MLQNLIPAVVNKTGVLASGCSHCGPFEHLRCNILTVCFKMLCVVYMHPMVICNVMALSPPGGDTGVVAGYDDLRWYRRAMRKWCT